MFRAYVHSWGIRMHYGHSTVYPSGKFATMESVGESSKQPSLASDHLSHATLCPTPCDFANGRKRPGLRGSSLWREFLRTKDACVLNFDPRSAICKKRDCAQPVQTGSHQICVHGGIQPSGSCGQPAPQGTLCTEQHSFLEATRLPAEQGSTFSWWSPLEQSWTIQTLAGNARPFTADLLTLDLLAVGSSSSYPYVLNCLYYNSFVLLILMYWYMHIYVLSVHSMYVLFQVTTFRYHRLLLPFAENWQAYYICQLW